jgi:adenine C2-methylase RlmN of 23S rRNA A2503 and tRNA A37
MLEVRANGAIVEQIVQSHPMIGIRAQEFFCQVAVMGRNAPQNNFSVVKNLPKIQTEENAFPNDGSAITIETAKMEKTKSIVPHLNATRDNGHVALTSLTTQIAFQVIIGVIKKSIVMTSQMNKIATIVRAKTLITNAVVAFV